MALSVGEFPAFFEELTGYEPFAWQRELASWLIDGRFPDQIDVPTGLGKTAVIVPWVFGLAASLERAQPDRGSYPLRLFFVVDRRLIVDSTFDFAARLAGMLDWERRGEAAPGPVTRLVAEILRGFAGADAAPLEVVRMRGGLAWESRWLARPHQPAVVVSTVDQFGSRLLFRGFGVTSSMQPINAALCGANGWLVIDEAHIAEPLRSTVNDVVRLQGQSGVPMSRLRMTSMSATQRASGDNRLETDESRESGGDGPAAAVARERLGVAKPALLHTVEVKGRGPAVYRELGKKLAEIASQRFAQEAGKFAILCNTVQAARAAFDALLPTGAKDGIGPLLLTGRVREFERERIASEAIARFGSGTPPADGSSLLVATQTVEVGADLDFDAVVTECAPFTSLVQRFGRVHRMGRAHSAESLVVYCPAAHDQDPVYGEATAATWGLLEEHAKQQRVDFSYAGVGQLRELATPETETRAPDVPVLLGAHVECWAHTSPLPAVDQPVDPFLHGFRRGGPPMVSVAWRAIPNDVETAEAWERWLALAPLSDWETVAVPLRDLRAFIEGSEGATVDGDVELSSDVAQSTGAAKGRTAPDASTDADETNAAARPVQGAGGPRARAALVGRTDEPLALIRSGDEIQPNAFVVIASSEGGYDRWGWTGVRSDQPTWVPDVADLAPGRRKRSVRVAPTIALSHGADPDQAHDPEAFSKAIDEAWQAFSAEDPAGTLPGVLDRFAELVGGPLGERYRLAAAGLRDGSWNVELPEHDDDDRWRIRDDDHRWWIEEGGRPVVRVVEREGGKAVAAEQTDDDEASTSLTGRAPATLAEHGERVGQIAREFAERLGLPRELVRAVELAGRWHDLGKADPRFQALLYDGDRLAAAMGELRAKSGLDPRDPLARQAYRVAGLPRFFRHEAVSGRLVRRLQELRPDLFDGVDAELVHHLVVAHHGRSRPLLPPIIDAGAPAIGLDVEGTRVEIEGVPLQADWEHPAVFVRLNERYGWWGLALLETIVRLADMWDSEQLAAAGETGTPATAAAGHDGVRESER